MIDSRTLHVLARIAEYAGTREAPLSLRTVCATCVHLTGMTGAWVGARPESATLATATDPLAESLADLQLLLGEGPATDAVKDHRPVAVTDLATAASRQLWPLFAGAAVDSGARAMLIVPLRVGATTIGLFGLYSRVPTVLVTPQRAEVDAFAGVIIGLLLEDVRHAPSDLHGRRPEDWPAYHPEIHQASGILSVQLGLGVAEALVCMRAHAYAQARPLLEIAREIVTHRLRFLPNTSETGVEAT